MLWRHLSDSRGGSVPGGGHVPRALVVHPVTNSRLRQECDRCSSKSIFVRCAVDYTTTTTWSVGVNDLSTRMTGRQPALTVRHVRTMESSNSGPPAFIPGIVFSRGGGDFAPPKNLQRPKRLPNCALTLYGHDNELQIYHRIFLLTDNKHRKLLSLDSQKGANLCLKCTRIRLAAGLCPDPLGELIPRPLRRNGGLLLRGWREGRLLLEGTEERERKLKRREFLPTDE